MTDSETLRELDDDRLIERASGSDHAALFGRYRKRLRQTQQVSGADRPLDVAAIARALECGFQRIEERFVQLDLDTRGTTVLE